MKKGLEMLGLCGVLNSFNMQRESMTGTVGSDRRA